MARNETANRIRPARVAGAVALALAGYAWLFLFPLLTLVLLAAAGLSTGEGPLVPALLGTGALLSGWVSLGLWRTRPRPPRGQRLGRAHCSELWSRVDELCAAYGGQRIDEIVLTPRFDVELVRVPRSGFPLEHHHALLIGLPLMQAVSPDHLAVLMARKLSLLPQPGNWPLTWLYHLRTTWHRYQNEHAVRRGLAARVMRLWFRWYTPLFIHYTRLVAQRCELDADRNALDQFETWNVEEAITINTVRKSFVENKLWPALLRMSQKYPNPPLLPYTSLEALIEKELDADREHRLLEGLLQAPELDDSHLPTLKRRWVSLSGNRPRVPVPVSTSAASFFLKGNLGNLQQQMDKGWLRANLQQWQERHAQAKQDQERLDRYLEELPRDLLSKEQLWECTLLVKRYMGQQKAVALYKALLATEPQDARIYFNIGTFLLNCRDAAGVKALEKAMLMDASYTPEACNLISEFMEFTGERRRARTYQRRAVKHSDVA